MGNLKLAFIPEAAITKWDDIEVQPVHEDEDGNCEPCEDEDAHFYSVYLHQVEGGIQCIADLPTEQQAQDLATLIKNAVNNYTENGYLNS